VILEDFVMLGTTVPEPNSDGRVFVCSAGISAEYRKLIRIYPLARRNVPHRWGEYRVRLERNPKDSREESFQVAGDRRPGAHERINEQFEAVRKSIPDRERIKLLSRYVVGSIKEANARRLSLAIIQPDAMEVTFDANPASAESPQMVLFDEGLERPAAGARRFAWMPRIRFHDELGWWNLMLRDWGTFELQRKKGEAYFRKELASALHLRQDSSLLVGNMNNQRTAWLVISVLNSIREAPTLFDALPSDREPIPDKIRIEVFKRDEWRCVQCGSTENLTIDHKWPHIRGGTRALENLQTLCRRCQGEKNDHVDGVT
jgi:HNH endonuclease